MLPSGVSLARCVGLGRIALPRAPQSAVEEEDPIRPIYPFKPILCGVFLCCVQRKMPVHVPLRARATCRCLPMPADLHEASFMVVLRVFHA